MLDIVVYEHEAQPISAHQAERRVRTRPRKFEDDDDDDDEEEEEFDVKRKAKNPRKIDYGSSSKRKEKIFRTFCRPNTLVNLIKQMNDEQKEAIKSIGFQGLLDLKVTRTRITPLLRWIVKNFNGRSRTLTVNEKKFVVKADDVRDVFLLPRGQPKGKKVLKKSGNQTREYLEYLNEKYSMPTYCQVALIEEALMKKIKDGGRDFKILFVLLAMSTFFTPTSRRKVDFSILPSLVNENQIQEYDWCSYILEALCKGAIRYNEHNNSYINACVPLLQILYFHRLAWKGIPEPKTLPLIKHWSNEKMRIRAQEENEAGDFGDGVLDTETYPISSKENGTGGSICEKRPPLSLEPDQQQIPKKSRSEAARIRAAGEDTCYERRTIGYKLPRGELVDSQIGLIAEDDVQKCFMKLRRDMAVMTAVCKERISEMEVIKDSLQSESDSQMFYSDENLLRSIDEVVEKLLQAKNIFAREATSVNLSSQPSDERIEDSKTNVGTMIEEKMVTEGKEDEIIESTIMEELTAIIKGSCQKDGQQVTDEGERNNFVSNNEPNSHTEVMENYGSSGSFVDLKTFEIVMNGCPAGSELSSLTRVKYYKLCCARKSYLHDQLLKSVNHKLAVEIILETVSIADAVEACTLSSTSQSDLEEWDKTLEGFRILGMDVGFLQERIRELSRLAGRYQDSGDAIRLSEVKVKEMHLNDAMTAIEAKLAEAKEAKINLQLEREILDSRLEKWNSTFQEMAKKPW